MWNDTDIPLAYLITFRCYGTWLHGDQRSSVDRFHNQYQSPYLSENKNLHRYKTALLKGNIINLNAEQRKSVEDAIHEVCEFRNWILQAVNVWTNHVHLVVSIGTAKPERALNDFKSYSTIKMRQNDCWHLESSPWSEKGSKRRLWNERGVELAIDYVINGQGDQLPDFD